MASLDMSTTFTPRQLEIIEASAKILTYSGIGSLTIKNIAKEMQFAESAVYRHFSSKEKIVKAMLDYLAQEMDERYAQILLPAEKPIEKLKLIFASHIAFFAEKPYFIGAIFPDGLLGGSTVIHDSILHLMGTMKKYLLPILEDCITTQAIRDDLAAEDYAHLMMGSFRLMVFKWRLANFEFDFSKKGNEIITNTIKLITP